MKRRQLSPRPKWVLLLPLAGVLLSSASASPKFKVLHRFYAGQNQNGGVWGGLTLDREGNLYGTTWGGGVNGEGTVFELMPSARGRWAMKVLYSLDRKTDGGDPWGTLLLDPDTTIYGTTSAGANRGGTVFEMTRTSGGWAFSVIDDYGSAAGVVADQAGNLYGSIGPGEYEEGAVTELMPGSQGWTQSYLYSFCAEAHCPDGSIPYSGVTFDGAGNLYGTTEYGGTGQAGGLGGGTAYELKHKPDGTWKHLVLHSFPAYDGDGMTLYAGLALDESGNLYGATFGGGKTNCGTIFELTHGAKGWKEALLHDFTQPKNGCAPSGVTFDRAGNLYGTTVSGGIGDCSGGCGVVFKLTPGVGEKWKYNVLHRFDNYDGAVPASGVILDGKGNLYGTTGLGGGGTSVGVVFEITP